jgi:hypothetical protein
MAFDAGGRLYVVELLGNRVAIVNLPSGLATTAPSTQPASRPEGDAPQ